MYNKLFTKILDSSIWLESMPTRIVWLTMIAAMDEHGLCQFASVANVAHRARVSLQEAETAIGCLEGADPNSSDPEHDGRRLERVSGGWLVLNAEKHRDIVTRAVATARTRERVRRHRATRNAPVTPSNASVTQSVAVAEAVSVSEAGAEEDAKTPKDGVSRGGAVVVSPLEFVKLQRHNAYVGTRLRVPHKLHGDFVAALGGDSPDTVLRAWYAEVDAEIEASREAIVPDVWKWLEARFKPWASNHAVSAEMARFVAEG